MPIARGITSSAILTPGVAATGPSNNLSISGAMSYENLYMVNGVVIQDNVRNTPNALYIEDAIQETTTSDRRDLGGVRPLSPAASSTP